MTNDSEKKVEIKGGTTPEKPAVNVVGGKRPGDVEIKGGTPRA